MKFKKLFYDLMAGVAAFVGYDLAKKVISTWRNPIKKETIKQNLNNIKDQFKD